MHLTVWLLCALRVYAYEKTRPNDAGVRDTGRIIEEDISLQSQVITWEEDQTDVWAEYYAVPWEFLNPQGLSEIGLSEYSQVGTYADLKSFGPAFTMNLPLSKEGLFIPKNTSLLFLFNTSTAHNFPDDTVSKKFRKSNRANIESFEVIQTSLPFGIPTFHYVADYSLLVPKSLFASQVNIVPFQNAGNWLSHMGLMRNAIPLSKDMVNKQELLLTFVFRSAKKLEDFLGEDELLAMAQQTEHLSGVREKSYNQAKSYIDESLLMSQSEVAKAVISSSSGFFDNFARKWVTAIGYESLLYSTFCQVNCRYHEQNYCLKFKQDQHATVSLLAIPADDLNSGRHEKRSFKETYEDKASESIENIKAFMAKVSDSARAGVSPLNVKLSDLGHQVKKRDLYYPRLHSRLSNALLNLKQQSGDLTKRALIDLSFVDKKYVSSEDCVQITWKRIFEFAFFGTNVNFCTRAQTLQQLQGKS